MKNRPLRILIISTNPPLDAMGGSLLFYRHFIGNPDYKVAVVTDIADKQTDGIPWLVVRHPAWLRRLIHTRLYLWGHDYIHLYAGKRIPEQVIRFSREFRPDLIIGGAETWLMDLALALGKKMDVPVAGFFMDWPTYASLGHTWCKERLGNVFRNRYQSCDVAFCICPEMMEALGPHPNAHVYYPSGELIEEPPGEKRGNGKFTLLFAGNLGQWYGEAITRLIQAIRDYPELALKVAGANAPWSKQESEELKQQGIFLGFLKGAEYEQALADADALLVIMGFREADRQVESTSFKSKIVDYLQQRKPLIIWGPEYSTAVRHARKWDFGEVVTDPDADQMVNCMNELSKNVERQTELIQHGERFFKLNLDAELVRKTFAETIHKLR